MNTAVDSLSWPDAVVLIVLATLVAAVTLACLSPLSMSQQLILMRMKLGRHGCIVFRHDWYECEPDCCGQTICFYCGTALQEDAERSTL